MQQCNLFQYISHCTITNTWILVLAIDKLHVVFNRSNAASVQGYLIGYQTVLNNCSMYF